MKRKTYICAPAGIQPGCFHTLEEAKAFADENARFGAVVREEGCDDILYAPFGAFVSEILRNAKEVCDYVRDQGFNYGNAPINPAINHDARLVSCDRFVGWVLYRLGYTDQPYQQGLCVASPRLTNWCIDHGFTKISSVADLLPGDIVFTRKDAMDCPGHTFLFAGRSDTPGNYYRYDCGRVERIRSTQPSCEPLTDAEFMYGYRIRPVGDSITPGLSFLYNGVPFSELDKQVEPMANGVKYTLPDGLILTSTLKRYPDQRVFWWVNRWENPTEHDSGLVTDLWDCDVTVPFAPDPKPCRKDRQDTWEPQTFRVYEAKGSVAGWDDYSSSYVRMWEGDTFRSSCVDGRSAHGKSPFFDINRNQYGVLLAVGWTGQWRVQIDRTHDAVRIRSGVQCTTEGFRVRPGESFRTSSAAMMMYFRGQDEAHNRFRSFMREISPVGPGSPRGEQCPFSAIFWGGVPTANMLDRWSKLLAHDLPFDTCWIDAGWYEPLRATTMDGQLNEWANVAQWAVNKQYHPDGYRDLVNYLHAHGIDFMVWFEPERVCGAVADLAPDWMETLPPDCTHPWSMLVSLNKDEICDKLIDMVSDKIKELSLSVYRQDFNFDPLTVWLNADEPERHGITEIKYINNLYRFWDTLLERFPTLLIDNCSGGGNRNDIEMLSRAVPLWRSDYQCVWDCLPEANQMQNQAAWWMPYAGIGYGPTLGDLYSFRSAYCNGMAVRTWEHTDPEWEVGASGEPLDWAKKYFDEYNSIRHFFAQDYYPLVPFSRENSAWSASQWHDPQTQKGVILAFRRAASPFEEVIVKLSGLLLYKDYEFTNADTNDTFTATGYELSTKGVRLKIAEPRQSLLWRYE